MFANAVFGRVFSQTEKLFCFSRSQDRPFGTVDWDFRKRRKEIDAIAKSFSFGNFRLFAFLDATD